MVVMATVVKPTHSWTLFILVGWFQVFRLRVLADFGGPVSTFERKVDVLALMMRG